MEVAPGGALGGALAVGPDADVEQHQVALAVGTRRPAQGAVGHGQQGVGPVHVGRGGGGGGIGGPGAERLVARHHQGPLHQGALVGGQLGGEPPGAGLGVAEADPAGLLGGLGCLGLGGIGLGLLVEGVAAQHPAELDHGAERASSAA